MPWTFGGIRRSAQLDSTKRHQLEIMFRVMPLYTLEISYDVD